MINVVCVFTGNRYSIQYVKHLQNTLQRNLTLPHKFTIFSHYPVDIPNTETIPLPRWNLPDSKAWWYKIYMFNSELEELHDTVLYFDLDIVIQSNINNLIEQVVTQDKLHICQDFHRVWDKTYEGSNSSIMLWDRTKFGYVYDDFKNNRLEIQNNFKSDQEYLDDVVIKKAWFDKTLYASFKWEEHYITTPIIVFHGQPKPHEIKNNKIIEDNWK